MSDYKYSKYNHHGQLEDGSVLVYNLFSSAVAVLSQEEFQQISNPTLMHNPELYETAASQGFLVPADEDETAKLLSLRNTNNFNDKRAGFQILPTTSCNARCFYCYEQDFQPSTMTKETADAVVSFLLDYCENMEDVTVAWFGGEPFVCEGLMDYISSKLIPALEARGTRYQANVITNASLISTQNIEKIVAQYRISNVQITLDGRGEEHTRRKKYLDPAVTYEKIIDTIALLTRHQVHVMVRLNLDRNNLESCIGAIEDLANSGADQDYLWPYGAPLYSDCGGTHCLREGELNAAFEKLYRKLIDCGYIRSIDGLPMNFANAACCAKILNNFVISPNGELSKCEHLLNVPEEVIGSVFDGIRFNAAMAKWTDPAIPAACMDCSYLPICQAGCSAAEQRGFGYGRCSHIAFIQDAVISAANYLLRKRGEKDDDSEKQQRDL